jgi:UDP-N-acetylmuramate--alanine ligase
MNTFELEKYLVPGSRAHLVGIGGVSMSPLAEVLHGMGVIVSGSDMNESDTVKHLRSLGIQIYIGHRAENIDGAGFVIRTAAVHDDNPEIAAARAKGVPVFERAQAWGIIMRRYQDAVCISGTHGKTTTTSMVTHILMAAENDPTVMIGGTLPLLKSGHRVGRGGTIVLESCEYYNSFHSFFPTVAVILDVDEDHLDFFSGLDEIKQSFRKFACLVPEDGWVIVNADDENSMEAVKGIDRRVMTFGTSPECSVYAANIEYGSHITTFDIIYKGKVFTKAALHVPGKHNVLNALAAASAAIVLGIPAEAVSEGLESFSGAGRRFEFKGRCNGADVYDDYAHHPGELHALLDAVSSLGYERVVLAFQPHTYTRTKALFDDFVRELSRADALFLAEIYAAREQNTIGISSADLADKIPGAVFCPTFKDLEDKLRDFVQPGDIVLTVGAGNIFRVGENIVEPGEDLAGK